MADPVEATAPLTLQDQILVNCLGYLCLEHGDWANIEMTLVTLEEILPGVSLDHPRVGPLANAAEQMLRATLAKTRAEKQRRFTNAAVLVRAEVARLFLYRAAVGYERLQDSVVEDAA